MKNSTRTLVLVCCIMFSSLSIIARNKPNNQPSPQAAGLPGQANMPLITPFYTEDFGSGLPATWQAIDSTGPSLNWKHTTAGANDGTQLSATGTTAANGYMIYDSDSAGGNMGVDKSDLISGPVDCSTHPNVHLNFNEFLAHFNDTCLVYVSNDGATWTEVRNSSLGMAQYDVSANPNNVDIDISTWAAGQDSVWIRFSYHADYSFYWMIDDVILHEVAQQDAGLASITAPASSCAGLTNSEPVSITIYNNGGDTITSCMVTYVVDGGTPETDTVSASIPVAGTHPYTFTVNTDVSALGTHTIQVYVTLAGDTNTANDTAMITIFNGPRTIDQANNYSFGFEANEDMSTWVFEDANLDSMTWEITTNTPHGGTMSAILLTPLADDWLFTTCLDLDSGVTYGLSYYHNRLNTARQANLQIGIGNAQNAGGMGQLIYSNAPVTNVIYQQAYHIFTVPNPGVYYIGFEISNADSAVGYQIDDINIGVDGGIGIIENMNDLISVYPNPTSDVVYLNSKLVSKNGYTVQVMNSLGELVSMNKAQFLNDFKVDMSNLSAGLYIVRVVTENGTAAYKITVQ